MRSRPLAPLFALLFALLCLPAAARAQGATAYPSSLDTGAQLPLGADAKLTYLTAPVTDAAATIHVASTAGLPPTVIAQVGAELIACTVTDPTTLAATARGFSGTTPEAHPANAAVRFPLTARHVSGLQGAILALEAKLGVCASDASSAAAGQVLTRQAGGCTRWQDPGGGGGGLANAYAHVADGTHTADAAGGGDTLELRSADVKLSVAVTDDDPAHGDNALFTVNQGSFDRNALGGGALSAANGGTGVTDFSFSGSTHKAASVTGAITAGDCAKFDASGNLADSGGACGGVGGSSPTATNGEAVLSSSPTDVTATGYANVSLSVSLPAAGTYLVSYYARALVVGSGAAVDCQLYNSTDSAAVANSEANVIYNGTSGAAVATSGTASLVTTSGAKTVDLQCRQRGSPAAAQLYSDASGRTKIVYVKLN